MEEIVDLKIKIRETRKGLNRDLAEALCKKGFEITRSGLGEISLEKMDLFVYLSCEEGQSFVDFNLTLLRFDITSEAQVARFTSTISCLASMEAIRSSLTFLK